VGRHALSLEINYMIYITKQVKLPLSKNCVVEMLSQQWLSVVLSTTNTGTNFVVFSGLSSIQKGYLHTWY